MNEFLRGHHLKLPFILLLIGALSLAPGASVLAENGFVARAQFTTAVTSREPEDSISDISNADKVFFFTELINMTGSTVVHRWLYKSSVAAEVSFNVNGPRWRVYSSKQLEGWMTGDWTMEIVVDDTALEETYSLQVIDDNASPETYSSAAPSTSQPEPPGEILALQQLFPDTGVVSISTQGDIGACPPAEHFQWQQKTSSLWHYHMADSQNLPIYIDTYSPGQPHSTTTADCIIQTTHQLTHDQSELIIETTDSCIDSPLPVLSVTALKRVGDELDLLIFADTMSHCRYRLIQ